MKNNYGNYVVQKALKISIGPLKFKLIISILKNIEKVGDKKLMAKWKNIVICTLPNDREMNNTEGELIYKLLKSLSIDDIPTIDKNISCSFVKSRYNNKGNYY